MMEARLIFMALVCLCIAQMAFAVEPNYPFKSPIEQQRFEKLLKGTRCVICQNQSLFESNSAIAGDMRRQIYSMLGSGATDGQIQTYLRDRYGDSIMFMPPWRFNTALLWLGPVIMLILAIAAYRRLIAPPKLMASNYASC